MNSLDFASTILLTPPEASNPKLKSIRREQVAIRKLLRKREQMGTCKVELVQETDLLSFLPGYKNKSRVAILHIYPDEHSFHTPPPSDVLDTFKAALSTFEQLHLVVLHAPVAPWLLQTLFEAGIPAVWVSMKKRNKTMKRFYQAITNGASIHAAILDLPSISWEMIQEGDQLPNSFFQQPDQAIQEGLYYREGKMDSLSWQVRDPVKIEISKRRFSIPMQKRWGLRFLMATLLLFIAIMVALFILPNMNKIF